MSGEFDFDTEDSPPLTGLPVVVVVALRDRDLQGDQQYTVLPNVICESIEFRNGGAPSVARFRYIFDDTDPSAPYPTQLQQYFPLNAPELNPYAMAADDELVVFGFTDNGARRALFDGFVLAPQGDLSEQGHAGSFTAVGVEIRAWDTPITGSVWRNADAPEDPTDFQTIFLPAHFNPNVNGEPRSNCTPEDTDVDGTGTFGYPVFLEANLDGNRNPDPATFWTLPKFCAYILRTADEAVLEYVNLPSTLDLYSKDDHDALIAILPRDGEFIDITDANTFSVEDIIIRDFLCPGMCWPDALRQQLEYYGFEIRWELSTDENGDPQTDLAIYRRDDLGTVVPKTVPHQANGILDPTKSIATGLSFSRDSQNLQNSFEVLTRPVLYEVAVILSPGFTITGSDAMSPNQFTTSEISKPGVDAQQKLAYRVYIADEAGDGHWSYDSSAFVTDQPFDFSKLFKPNADGSASYVRRYRPGKGTLISRDDQGRRRKADLAISRDYTGGAGGLWDGTGTWDYCGDQGWKLLKDRLGIAITAENPNAWKIPLSDSSSQVPGGIVHGVEWQAAPTDSEPVFYLMLTTVIESDEILDASAPVRDASPSLFEIKRQVEAREHFKKEVVDGSSPFYDANPDPPLRDDTKLAQGYALSLRAAHEFPPVMGTITIPFLTNAYLVGDRIKQISGINLDLTTNAGVDAGETPYYPMVAALTFQLGDKQSTVLHLTSRREAFHSSAPAHQEDEA